MYHVLYMMGGVSHTCCMMPPVSVNVVDPTSNTSSTGTFSINFSAAYVAGKPRDRECTKTSTTGEELLLEK